MRERVPPAVSKGHRHRLRRRFPWSSRGRLKEWMVMRRHRGVPCGCRARADVVMEDSRMGPGSGSAQHRHQRRMLDPAEMRMRQVTYPEAHLRSDMVGWGRYRLGQGGHGQGRAIDRGGATDHQRRPQASQSGIPAVPEERCRLAGSKGRCNGTKGVAILVEVRLVFRPARLPGALPLAPCATHVPAQGSINLDEGGVVVRVPIWFQSSRNKAGSEWGGSLFCRVTRSESRCALTWAW